MRIFIFALSVFFLIPSFVFAATMRLVPENVYVSPGEIINVNVLVDSTDQPLNAVSGMLSFANDVFEVISISKANSIISFWAQDPYFINAKGQIFFEGVVLNPGFQGSDARVVSIALRAKTSGVSNVAFDSASVLANDGQGTPILDGVRNASYTVENTSVETSNTEEVIIDRKIDLPVYIESLSHPDEENWYQSQEGTFSWNLGASVTRIRMVVSKDKNAALTQIYTPAISNYVSSLQEGINYVRLQLYADSEWGSIVTMAVKVDATNPTSLNIEESARPDLTDPRVRFEFSASDSVSGIQHFATSIDDGPQEYWIDDGTGVYSIPPLGPGVHTISVAAVDQAGNYISNSKKFVIDPLPTPTIISVERKNKVIIVNGAAMPNTLAVLSLSGARNEHIEEVVTVSDSGFFAGRLFADRPGFYVLSTLITDVRGGRSHHSAPETVVVGNFFELVVETIRNALSIFIPSIIIIVIFGLVIAYGYSGLRKFRRRLLAEETDVVRVVKRSFHELRDEINDPKTHKPSREVIKIIRKVDSVERAIMEELQDVRDVTSGASKDIDSLKQ